jgi:thiol-disulfide isomerase/thioredoxin
VLLASGKVQLVEFFAYWNGPSLAMAPVVQQIEQEYRGKANFVYLDVDDPATKDFQRQLGFRIEPQFFLLDAQGRVLRQWVGYVTLDQFRQALNAALYP